MDAMFKVMGKGHFTFVFCLYEAIKAKIITDRYPTQFFCYTVNENKLETILVRRRSTQTDGKVPGVNQFTQNCRVELNTNFSAPCRLPSSSST